MKFTMARVMLIVTIVATTCFVVSTMIPRGAVEGWWSTSLGKVMGFRDWPTEDEGRSLAFVIGGAFGILTDVLMLASLIWLFTSLWDKTEYKGPRG